MNDGEAGATFRAAMSLDPRWVHLNNAGVAPMCRPAREAAEQVARLMAERGSFGIDPLIEMFEDARTIHASLVGCQPAQLAFTQTCAASISLVAFGLELRPGDEILFLDQEYPSNAYPWVAAARRSRAEVRQLRSGRDLSVGTDRIVEAITPRTRVLALSWVQYQAGATSDLATIAAACHAVGAWLVVDAIQGLGVIPFDMSAAGVDAVCGGGHKWLCGPLGHGFLALADRRATELTPVLQGALSYGSPDDLVDLGRELRADARRFEPGAPPLLTAIPAAAGIRLLLDIGIDAIHRRAVRLAARVAEAVRSSGGRVIGSPGQEGCSPITTFVPRAPIEETHQSLVSRGIAAALRGGGIRVAPHGFNTDEEIDLLMEVLSGVEGSA